MALTSIDPATGKQLREYPEMTADEVDRRLLSAHGAFLAWKKRPPAERAALLRSLAGELRSHVEKGARLITAEMGKPIAQARAEVEKCATAAEYYAESGPGFLAPEYPVRGEPSRYVSFQPLGLILGVMPWNFPYWQVFRAAIPALMAGNGFLLKHAANTTGCALAVEELFRRAGFPADLMQALVLPSSRVAELIGHPLIRGVTLTGSTQAGKQVASAAGAAMKKTVLELGGSDPYLILADADLDRAAEICAQARLVNSGQSCVAAKRFIVDDSVREAFESRLAERMAARRMGDPLDASTEVGPMARGDLRAALHEQVLRSVELGARLLLGGAAPDRAGFYYPPTVLSGVCKGMPAFDEELFGPVAAIIPVPDEAAAIAAANDSPFGLGAAVFTRDQRRGERIAREEIDAGLAFVNDFVQSDPRLPFGGVKESGYGRELSSFGIREFVNVKTICIGA